MINLNKHRIDFGKGDVGIGGERFKFCVNRKN